ncbi:dynein assembly factor 5, axonemal [Cimex lectularius]|uniref:Dynein assembly factor 5, axonemal n=1 Tax=Cimex lectularius TaxID=79782 RepID=A0A8I6S975_CIMLE|nr:dynein assembly factor 5, axonemal [Cimex lectularius]
MDSGEAGFADLFLVERTVNILQSGDRAEKVSTLKKVKKYLNENDEEKLLDLYEHLSSTLLRLLQDPNEAVREHSLQLLDLFLIEKLTKNKIHLKNLIPVLYSRMCSDNNTELSEELKLLYSKFLTSVVKKYENDLIPYLEEIVSIVIKLLPYPAPEVKKSASKLCVTLVTALPAETFQYSKKLVNPLFTNLSHQHWRVRVATIETLEILMLKGDNKCVPDIINPVTRCLFDNIEHVRMAVTRLVGHWMVDLFDRYSFFSHFLPVILTSLSDESQEIRTEAKSLWEKAGKQYLQENEKDYKDRIDYENEYLEHYPKGVKRPGLGCRIIVEQEGSKFLLALVHELSDWNERVRLMSSVLLFQYAIHAETSITQSLHKILNGMCKAAMDYETPKVMENVVLAAQYMGYFVPPKVYCSLIVSHLKEANAGELKIVTGLVKGSKSEDLRLYLPDVTSLLNNTSFEEKEHLAILDLISAVFSTCADSSLDIGDKIWAALISIAGLTDKLEIRKKSLELLDKFVEFGGGDRKKVFNSHCSTLLQSLQDTLWTAHCHQQFILASIIENGGEIIEPNLQLFISILQEAMAYENDPEVILKVTMAINNLLSNNEKTLPSEQSVLFFIKTLLKDIIVPHLKWHPGRSAEAIRTVACTCLYMCLLKVISKCNSISEINDIKSSLKQPKEILDKETEMMYKELKLPEVKEVDYDTLLPLVISLVEDASPKTRILSLNCIQLLSNTNEAHQTDQFYNIITNTIKRMEDSDKSVRLLALQSIQKLYEDHIKKEEQCNYINKGLLEFVYSTLLIHLDDQQASFRESVLECLKSIGKIDAVLLRRKWQLNKFRNKDICEKLIEHIENYLVESVNK